MAENLDCTLPTSTRTTKDQHKRKTKTQKMLEKFGLSKTDIKRFKKHTSITKTCRALAKHLYPNFDVRSQMTILRMSDEEKNDIIGKISSIYP